MQTKNMMLMGAANIHGLWLPQQRVIRNSDPAPDLSPIDLTKVELDPRISFKCASRHAFWMSNGVLGFAAANTWPLSYVGGIAIGRHEPEPAATNLQVYSRVTGAEPYNMVSGDYALTASDDGAPDQGAIALVPLRINQYWVTQDVGGVSLVNATPYVFKNEWQRIANTFVTSARSRIRFRVAYSTTGNLWATQSENYGDWPAGGTYAASWFYRQVDDESYVVGFVQLEAGALSTSPLITEDAQTTKRAESMVIIDTKHTSSLTVYFSDGSSEMHKTPDKEFTLPFAPKNWGERYITRIRYGV